MDARATFRRITVHVAAASGLLAAVALVVGGVASGLSALVGGGLAVANWLAMRWVGARLLVANERGRALLARLLAAKMAALLGVAALILSTGVVDATGFTVGLSGLVLGVLSGAFRTALGAEPGVTDGADPAEASEEK